MTITCYLIDDEYHAIELLKSYALQTFGLEVLGCSTDPQEALHEVSMVHRPDIIFLDIDMQELSGLQFAEMVNMTSLVIFTTSYPQYAVEAFDKQAFDYLLKPITYERFLKAVNKVRKKFLEKGSEKGKPDSFFIKTEIKGKIVRIPLEEILYVEGLLNYVRIHLKSVKHIAYLTMSEMEELLSGEDFTRVHKSFIIRDQAIISVEQNQIRMLGNDLIPLGRAYREAFLTKIKQQVFKSRRDHNG